MTTYSAAPDMCHATNPTSGTECIHDDGHESHDDGNGNTWTSVDPFPEPRYPIVRERVGRALVAARRRRNGERFDEQHLADAAVEAHYLLASLDSVLRQFASLNAEVLLLREAHSRLERRVADDIVDQPIRPTIVCLCGSTRFGDAFRDANLRETLAGRIVLSIGCDLRTDHELWPEEDERERLKTALDELHLRKIDLADEVFVLNVDGYIGESTRSEIDYAEAKGKPVRYLEPVAAGAQ